MSWTTYHNKPDAYLDEAYEVTAKRIKVSEWLMDNTEWDLMASVWVSIDRTQHALSNYVAPDHPDYVKNKDTRIGRKVADIFRQADEAIGSFVSRARPDDIILFISRPRVPVVHAHGQHGPHAEGVRLPGLQRLQRGVRPDAVGARCARSRARSTTRWGCTGRSRCRSRSTGRRRRRSRRSAPPARACRSTWPAARSTASSTPATSTRSATSCSTVSASYVDPKTGKKPVKEIYKREEIFKGKYADTAPDILMVPAEGYSLTHAKAAIEDADWVSGDHRIEGTIVAVGPNVKPFETPPALIDMAPTLVAALDAPTAVKPTGRVLHEIVGARELVAREATEQSSAGSASRAWATRPTSPTPKPTRWKSTSEASATSSKG